jgi:hypothetical protein
MNRTKRDRIHLASTTLSSLVAAIEAGESVGRERLGDLREVLAAVRNEPEPESTQEHQRYYIIPVLSFDKMYDTLDTPQIVIQILRDAVSDFIFNRAPVEEYVRRRYSYMAPEQRAEKHAEVLFRTRLAADFSIEHLEIAMYDPRHPPPSHHG